MNCLLKGSIYTLACSWCLGVANPHIPNDENSVTWSKQTLIRYGVAHAPNNCYPFNGCKLKVFELLKEDLGDFVSNNTADAQNIQDGTACITRAKGVIKKISTQQELCTHPLINIPSVFCRA